jgi:two-component system, cell cycle sensor histidine kinase and response regulator CckA
MPQRGASHPGQPDAKEHPVAERFVALFRHMQEGVALHEMVFDADGKVVDYRFIDVNPQFEACTGLRAADIVGKLASQVYGEESPLFLKDVASVAREGTREHRELHLAASKRYLSLSVAPVGRGSFATILSDITFSKKQTAALEKSRLSQRALLDNQPHLAWLKDREGHFLAVNQAFAQACGQPDAESVAGKTDLDVWPRGLAEAYRADDLAVIELGTRKVVEEQIADVDGTRWFETYKSPVFAPDGSIIGTTGIARDITERKRAEEARLRSERKLGQMLDLAPDPVVVTTVAGEITFVNQAYCELVGHQRSEVVGRRAEELEGWQGPKPREEVMARLHRDGRVEAYEVVLVDKNGGAHHVEFTAARVEFDEATSIILAGRDVTQRRKDESALRDAERTAARSHEQLLSVSELAHIGHFTLDFKSNTVTWTRELFRIAGRDQASFQPTMDSVRQAIHPEDLAGADDSIAAAVTLGRGHQIDFRVVRPNGEVRHCLGIVEVEQGLDLPAKKVHGLVQDLTEIRRAEQERRRLEQQVMHSQKLESLGVLAGGIAHDFNNLLTSILGNADLALSDLAATNPARSYLEDIENVSRRAADLCRQLLAYSGRGRFVVQPISLNELVREMAHLLSISISKKVIIKYNFFPELPSVMADATQLRQVVMNLITNASEAIAEVSGVVTLSTGLMDCDDEYLKGAVDDSERHPAGQYVYVEVSDTGCGMDQATLGRIFDPFYTTKFTGRGLGLAAVLGIVRGHKGAVRVYSEKGRGTTFKILLPAHYQPAPTLSSAHGRAKAWQGRGLVLLADDEESIRSMGRRLLEKAGFEVVVAADGREALEVFEHDGSRVRLVILDLTMPHLDGEACYRELRRMNPAVKVIMTSGYNEQDVVNRFVGKGLSGFVQKPYQASDLLPVVRDVLGEPVER